MKRIITFMIIFCVMLTMALASPLSISAAEGNTVLVMDGWQDTESRELEIVVSVKENAGVASMLLSLEYDTSAFTLTDVEYGSALSSLSPIHTNTETTEGYGIYPFKISYLGEANDTSTGTMMTLRFKIKDDAPDGNYIITFKCDRDKEVSYLEEGRILTRNLLINGAKITMEGKSVSKIESDSEETLPPDSTKSNTVTVIVISCVAVFAVGGTALLLMLKKRKIKKKWIKL